MAIYTNLALVDNGSHGLFESSLLKSTDIGRNYSVRVQDEDGDDIAVDNGVAVKVLAHTGDGLEERLGTIAAVADKIGVVGSPAIIKDAFTKAQASPKNFYHKAGQLAKVYEVTPDDIFAVANYQFTAASLANVKVGNYVQVDGNGMWVASTSAPSAATGFVGKIHSIAQDLLEQVSMVRILCVQNI